MEINKARLWDRQQQVGSIGCLLYTSLFPSHRACRELKLAHYEWLVNLEELLGKGEFMFYGVPLRLKGGSGSPVRAFAVIEEGN